MTQSIPQNFLSNLPTIGCHMPSKKMVAATVVLVIATVIAPKAFAAYAIYLKGAAAIAALATIISSFSLNENGGATARTDTVAQVELNTAAAAIAAPPSITAKQWAHLQSINLPPYSKELRAFLDGDCTIWPGKKRAETHIVVPLFPQFEIDGCLVARSFKGLDQLGKASGGTGFRHIWNAVPTDTPAEKEFHYGVLTKDILPKSRSKSYDDQVALLPPGYEVPSALDAATAILWENRRTTVRLFSEDPCTYTRCKENIDGYQVVIGGFDHDGLVVSFDYYDYSYIGVAGWRKF